jgi:hypothetical protein
VNDDLANAICDVLADENPEIEPDEMFARLAASVPFHVAFLRGKPVAEIIISDDDECWTALPVDEA